MKKNMILYFILSAVFLGIYFYLHIIMNIFAQTFTINFPLIGLLYIVMGFLIFTLFMASYHQEPVVRFFVVGITIATYVVFLRRPWQSMFIDAIFVMFLLSHLIGFIIPKDYFID